MKKSWNKVNQNKWQTKNRTKIVESIDKLVSPSVNNQKSPVLEKEIIKKTKNLIRKNLQKKSLIRRFGTLEVNLFKDGMTLNTTWSRGCLKNTKKNY